MVSDMVCWGAGSSPCLCLMRTIAGDGRAPPLQIPSPCSRRHACDVGRMSCDVDAYHRHAFKTPRKAFARVVAVVVVAWSW